MGVQLDTQDGEVDTQASLVGDHLDTHKVSRGVQVPTQPVAPGAEVLKALDLAEQLLRDNAALVARNEQLAGQVGFLQRQVIEQQETIQRLLPAPRDEPETPAEPEPVKPWWKRLFG
jgi:hypothetical protein